MRVWYGHTVEGAPYPDARLFISVVSRHMQSTVVPMVEGQVYGIIGNWKNAPGVETRVAVTPYVITAETAVTGPNVRFWRWVSHGVPGRYIRVRKKHTYRRVGGYKPALSLQRYRPKTLPGGSWGNPGRRYGPVWYRQVVWWPGIQPRNFENVLYEILYAPTMREMGIAIQKGFAAMAQRGIVGAVRRLIGR